jgi:hypothetical protein
LVGEHTTTVIWAKADQCFREPLHATSNLLQEGMMSVCHTLWLAVNLPAAYRLGQLLVDGGLRLVHNAEHTNKFNICTCDYKFGHTRHEQYQL